MMSMTKYTKEGYTEEQQKNMNFSLEEFISIAKPNKPIAVYTQDRADNSYEIDLLEKVMKSLNMIGCPAIEIFLSGTNQKYQLREKANEILDPNVALYVGRFYDSELYEGMTEFCLRGHKKIGFPATRQELFEDRGNKRFLPGSEWCELWRLHAVQDLNQILEPQRIGYANRDEGNYYRILVED